MIAENINKLYLRVGEILSLSIGLVGIQVDHHARRQTVQLSYLFVFN